MPAGFAFSVKLPKAISHKQKLVECEALLTDFLVQAEMLGDKLAVLLLQLPPKLAFDRAIAEPFLVGLPDRSRVRVAVEPRHPSWFDEEPERLLAGLGIARVAADPAICPAERCPAALGTYNIGGSTVRR